MNPPVQDRDLLIERGCTDIRGGDHGTASLVYGFQKETSKRLYVLRSGEHVTRFHLPARLSAQKRRMALSERQASLALLHPEGCLDLISLMRAANPHGCWAIPKADNLAA